MKRMVSRGLLVIEAIVCILLNFLNVSVAGNFSVAIAFPFAQIGAGLRTLSLSGGIGNALAIALYILISLLPVAFLLILRQRRKLYPEDWLLGLLSAALFFVIYLMVNPGFIVNMLGSGASPPAGNAILGSMAYSLIVGYLILRVLRLFSAGTIQKLEHYTTIMLGVLSATFVFLAFGTSFRNLLSSISSLQAGNIGNEHLLGTTYVFLALQYSIDALPYILDILVIFAVVRLLDELRIKRYSAASIKAAERMSRICAIALTVTVLSNILFNLLQLLFAKSLMVVNHAVQIPVASILFVLAALLLTRNMMESKQLKEENDQFV